MFDIRNFNEHSSSPLYVGELDTEKIFDLIGIEFSTRKVYMYPGAIKHIKRYHPEIWEKYKTHIPAIITSPDYIGQNPKEPNSIEMYKQIDEHVLLAVKLDPSGYLFISSMYQLDNAETKILKRLKSQRIKPF